MQQSCELINEGFNKEILDIILARLSKKSVYTRRIQKATELTTGVLIKESIVTPMSVYIESPSYLAHNRKYTHNRISARVYRRPKLSPFRCRNMQISPSAKKPHCDLHLVISVIVCDNKIGQSLTPNNRIVSGISSSNSFRWPILSTPGTPDVVPAAPQPLETGPKVALSANSEFRKDRASKGLAQYFGQFRRQH